MIQEFKGENFSGDDDNSVKNAIDIPKGQIQFIFWSTNLTFAAYHQRTSHVEPPGVFVCIRDDDDDVLKHFSFFFRSCCPFFLTDKMPRDNISRPLRERNKRVRFN